MRGGSLDHWGTKHLTTPMLARMRLRGDDAAVCFDAHFRLRIRFNCRFPFELARDCRDSETSLSRVNI